MPRSPGAPRSASAPRASASARPCERALARRAPPRACRPRTTWSGPTASPRPPAGGGPSAAARRRRGAPPSARELARAPARRPSHGSFAVAATSSSTVSSTAGPGLPAIFRGMESAFVPERHRASRRDPLRAARPRRPAALDGPIDDGRAEVRRGRRRPGGDDARTACPTSCAWPRARRSRRSCCSRALWRSRATSPWPAGCRRCSASNSPPEPPAASTAVEVVRG